MRAAMLAAPLALGMGCSSAAPPADADSGEVIAAQSGLCESPPLLYHNRDYEGPIRGKPGDVLFIPGTIPKPWQITVYYRAVVSGLPTLPPFPSPTPVTQDPASGAITPFAVDANGVTVRLPGNMMADTPFAIWVSNGGCLADPILINDPRPQWLSGALNPRPAGAGPLYVHATKHRPGIGRTIGVVGRNLKSGAGAQTIVKLERTDHQAVHSLFADPQGADLDEHVAQVHLPDFTLLDPVNGDDYTVSLSPDSGSNWAVMPEILHVAPDPVARQIVHVTDMNFNPPVGGCQPDDGVDDTLCIARAAKIASTLTPAGIVSLGAGEWNVRGECPFSGLDPAKFDTYPDPVTGNPTPYYPCLWPPSGGIEIYPGVDLVGAGAALTTVTLAPASDPSTPGKLLPNQFVKTFMPNLGGGMPDPGQQRTFLLTLDGHNEVSGIHFRDDTYWLQFPGGTDSPPSGYTTPALHAIKPAGNDISIDANIFDGFYEGIVQPDPAPQTNRDASFSNLWGDGVRYDPFYNLAITNNVFHTYGNPTHLNAIYEDAIISGNTFTPGAELAPIIATGTLGGRRIEYSHNLFDGDEEQYSNPPAALKLGPNRNGAVGFRAAIFSASGTSHEQELVAGNTMKCVGMRPAQGQNGEAINWDNNLESHAFTSSMLVRASTSTTVTVDYNPVAADMDLPVASWASTQCRTVADCNATSPPPTCKMANPPDPEDPLAKTGFCSDDGSRKCAIDADCHVHACINGLCRTLSSERLSDGIALMGIWTTNPSHTPGSGYDATENPYVGMWVRVDAGQGLGQSRKIVSAALTGVETLELTVSPPFDVVPSPDASRILVGQQLWQATVVANVVDDTCSTPYNANNPRGKQSKLGAAYPHFLDPDLSASGQIAAAEATADSVFVGNTQLFTGGIWLPAVLASATTGQNQQSKYFIDVRSNTLSGSFFSQNYASSHELKVPGDPKKEVPAFYPGRSVSAAEVHTEWPWLSPLDGKYGGFESLDSMGSGISLTAWVGDQFVSDDYSLPIPDRMGFGISISHNTLGWVGMYDPNYNSVLRAGNIVDHFIWAIGVGDGPAALPAESAKTPAFTDTLVFANSISDVPTAAPEQLSHSALSWKWNPAAQGQGQVIPVAIMNGENSDAYPTCDANNSPDGFARNYPSGTVACLNTTSNAPESLDVAFSSPVTQGCGLTPGVGARLAGTAIATLRTTCP